MNALYEKIVVPLDGSPLAEQIFPHLKRLSLPAATELHLVGVLEAWRYALGASEFGTLDLVTYLRDDLQAYLVQQQQALQQQGYRVSIHCHDGDAALTIVDVAEQVGAQLIALTTHGRSGIRRWTLGSVAERILHQSTLPIFLVRHETIAKDALQRLLVPLDGSPLAEEVLPQAITLAQATGASILLLQVIQTIDPTNQRLLFSTKAEAESALQWWTEESERYLERVGEGLHAAAVPYATRVRTGDPDRVICATTVDAAIDLVVMSTHGRTGFSRWVYGSVANKVLRGVECPLLLVRSRSVDDRARG